MPTWSTEKDLELVLILLAANFPSKRPQWNLVAQAMQNEFTASAISQRFTKTLAKSDVFLAAKAYFEAHNGKDRIGGDASGAGGAAMGTA
jgi:hypothetical protein